MKFNQFITLLTDFGLKDPYVSIMKGVIYSINPSVKVIDITHNIERHNIIQAAFILASAYKFFPKGTIHCVVVDPGVGTSRRALIVVSNNYVFIGPDNGVLALAANQDEVKKVYEIIPGKYIPKSSSNTFHGRDIFAPAAAYLSKGVKPEDLGNPVSHYIVPNFAKPLLKNNKIIGEVIYIDVFGNIITNIPRNVIEQANIEAGSRLRLKIGRTVYLLPFVRAYGEVGKGEPLILMDSFDFLEIAVNQDSAADMFKVSVGDKIEIYFTSR